MQYVNPTFTTPTSNGRLTDIEYEISVGLRCPKCRKSYDIQIVTAPAVITYTPGCIPFIHTCNPHRL